jgi:DNA-binding response OmpR family regulator
MTRNQNHPMQILLADDDTLLRAALCEFLGREGFVVHEAATGLAALEVLRLHRVTFSIMDVDMPGLTGFEVLKIVRQQLGAAMPCIFMSGDSSRERQMKALEVGAFSLLEKPIAPDLLRFSVQRLVDFHYGARR